MGSGAGRRRTQGVPANLCCIAGAPPAALHTFRSFPPAGGGGRRQQLWAAAAAHPLPTPCPVPEHVRPRPHATHPQAVADAVSGELLDQKQIYPNISEVGVGRGGVGWGGWLLCFATAVGVGQSAISGHAWGRSLCK